MSNSRTAPLTAFEVASVAASLMLIPANLVARVTFTSCCKQAVTLLRIAQLILDQPAAGVPEPLARRASEPVVKKAAYPPDICPPAVMSQD
jgi:hypothetical protein